MFFGACAGSTASGAKIDRLIVLIKNTRNEFYRIIHPNSITTVRVNIKVVPNEAVNKIIAFQQMMPYLSKEQQEELALTLGMDLQLVKGNELSSDAEKNREWYIPICYFQKGCAGIVQKRSRRIVSESG